MSGPLVPEPFSWGLYGHYLDVALDCGYRFIGAEDLADGGAPSDPAILLRHDVDYAPERIDPIASIEADRGVSATYCVLATSPLYSLEERRTADAIEGLLSRGHRLGLHFDASEVPEGDDEGVVSAAVELAAGMSERFGSPVRAVSFHMPSRRPVRQIELPPPLINLYGPRFFDEIGYVSDSNQDWRGKDLEDVLRSGEHRCLQVLTHPFWWRESYAPILEKLEALAEERGVDPGSIITPEQREIASSQGDWRER